MTGRLAVFEYYVFPEHNIFGFPLPKTDTVLFVGETLLIGRIL